MAWQRTKHPGVYVRHTTACPASDTPGTRCKCQPAYRARRRHPVTGKVVDGPSYRDIHEALSWYAGAGQKATPVLRERADAGRTFKQLAGEWWQGVEHGRIGKRRGKRGYSRTTLQGYDRSLRHVLIPEFGPRPASEIGAPEWQLFVDTLARDGLSRSRIANHLAVVRAIYSWACRPTRRLVAANPTIGVELPPVDEVERDRAATAGEAEALLESLSPEDRVPYALAFYAGLRRSEMDRLQWPDVDLERLWLVVRQSKSDAGTGRRLPIAAPLKPILLRAYMLQRRPERGRVLGGVSVTSGRLAPRARKEWTKAADDAEERGGQLALDPIGLHECRHTYASFLIAAGYTLRELMEYVGHSSLQATERYVKLLPQPAGPDGAADRLNAYLAGIGRSS
ncbi:MAG: tyrosine-type recombinase/integrase [Solirubrobacteraceae bacterium]